MNSKKLLSIGLASASVCAAGFGSALSNYADVTYGNYTITTAQLTARGLTDADANAIIAYIKSIASSVGIPDNEAAFFAYEAFKNANDNNKNLSYLKNELAQLAAAAANLTPSVIANTVNADGSINIANIHSDSAAAVFKLALDDAARASALTITTKNGLVYIGTDDGGYLDDNNDTKVKKLVQDAGAIARQKLLDAARDSSSSSTGHVSFNTGSSSNSSSSSSKTTSSSSSTTSTAVSAPVAVTYAVTAANPVIDAKKALATIVESKTPAAVQLKTEVATWTFNSKDLNKDQSSWSNFSTAVQVAPVTAPTVSAVVPKNVAAVVAGKQSVVVDFSKTVVDSSKNKVLPGIANVSVKLGDTYKNKEVYAYYINNGKFQLLTTSAKTDEHGCVSLSLNHGCSFLIIEKSVGDTLASSLKALEVK